MLPVATGLLLVKGKEDPTVPTHLRYTTDADAIVHLRLKLASHCLIPLGMTPSDSGAVMDELVTGMDEKLLLSPAT